MLRIRLRRKLLRMNGVDVSRLQVGDIMELSDDHANMMIENGWAETVTDALIPLQISETTQPNFPR